MGRMPALTHKASEANVADGFVRVATEVDAVGNEWHVASSRMTNSHSESTSQHSRREVSACSSISRYGDQMMAIFGRHNPRGFGRLTQQQRFARGDPDCHNDLASPTGHSSLYFEMDDRVGR